MARRNGWYIAALILSMMLAVAPAGSAQPQRAHPATDARTWLPQLWRMVIERVVPEAWQAKLGPGMDPDGLVATSVPPVDVSGVTGDLGPDMDPNGAK